MEAKTCQVVRRQDSTARGKEFKSTALIRYSWATSPSVNFANCGESRSLACEGGLLVSVHETSLFRTAEDCCTLVSAHRNQRTSRPGNGLYLSGSFAGCRHSRKWYLR